MPINCLFGQEIVWRDSVHQVVSKMPDTARLTYLSNKIQENEQNASRLIYARMLYTEASQQHSEEYMADAIYMFARHFYTQNSDSMRYWMKIGEPLFVRLNRLEDICRMKAWNIYLLNREGQRNVVLSAIDELKDFSDKNNYPEGIEMADQAMADFYFTHQLVDDGEKLYLDVLKRMEKRNAPLINRFNIVRQLCAKMPDRKDRIKYLKQAEGYLKQAKEKGLILLNTTPLYSLEYVIHRNYAQEYTSEQNLSEAWIHLQKADSIANAYQMVRASVEMASSYCFYYITKGDYINALKYLDTEIEHIQKRNIVNQLFERLEQKAMVLDKLGRSREAYELSLSLLDMKDSINQKDFHKTLASVRTEYEVERLEIDKQRMQEQAGQTRMQMTFLIGACILLLIIIVSLIYMIRIIQRNRRELRIAKEKAEEADRLKSTFLANMNHEIRTPLNAIVGFSQVLVDEEDKGARLEYANIIQSNNELLQRIISDVLDISKIDSNLMSLIYSSQDLPAIMKELYNVISLRVQPGVELILDSCEPFVLETDRNRLQQILTNLLGNAIKHTHSGHIRFGYQLLENEVEFYVEDTGAGIPEDQLEKIFDRFTQLGNGKKGVGLGLAISKGLVMQMGGEIWATSEKGVGSVFYVKIPPNKISR